MSPEYQNTETLQLKEHAGQAFDTEEGTLISEETIFLYEVALAIQKATSSTQPLTLSIKLIRDSGFTVMPDRQAGKLLNHTLLAPRSDHLHISAGRLKPYKS
eukprot:gnl/MRDRNA2_/MRDRNA2_499142_c0_seq1.p1 gnl/MRDRNA2_/MRDRNA2_499142_c0~~gnl/MRDRNA2_/MRDRNA2_499142_c0_seq1.p1  ORF type:complete len:102 (+),score=14.35 gnl/MRDRNA2_/MRDRNA2_499142_c0_seq1:66-371(+)